MMWFSLFVCALCAGAASLPGSPGFTAINVVVAVFNGGVFLTYLIEKARAA